MAEVLKAKLAMRPPHDAVGERSPPARPGAPALPRPGILELQQGRRRSGTSHLGPCPVRSRRSRTNRPRRYGATPFTPNIRARTGHARARCRSRRGATIAAAASPPADDPAPIGRPAGTARSRGPRRPSVRRARCRRHRHRRSRPHRHVQQRAGGDQWNRPLLQVAERQPQARRSAPAGSRAPGRPARRSASGSCPIRHTAAPGNTAE